MRHPSRSRRRHRRADTGRDAGSPNGKAPGGSETNALLWYREEYLVVLAERRDYWLLKTAYCTEQRGRIERLRRVRDAFHRAAGQGGQND